VLALPPGVNPIAVDKYIYLSIPTASCRMLSDWVNDQDWENDY